MLSFLPVSVSPPDETSSAAGGLRTSAAPGLRYLILLNAQITVRSQQELLLQIKSLFRETRSEIRCVTISERMGDVSRDAPIRFLGTEY